MKRLILTVALIGASTTAFAAELKDLAGSYKPTAVTKSGQNAPKADLDQIKGVTIAGDKFTVTLGEDKKVATIKVDGKASPATFDLTPEDGPKKGEAIHGIFTFEKGVLKIAMGETGGRPKDFKGAGAGEMVITLEKVAK